MRWFKVERLRRKTNFSQSERKEIVRKMVKGYQRLEELNEDFTNVSLLEDGAN